MNPDNNNDHFPAIYGPVSEESHHRREPVRRYIASRVIDFVSRCVSWLPATFVERSSWTSRS
jgi:hypothetical protein